MLLKVGRKAYLHHIWYHLQLICNLLQAILLVDKLSHISNVYGERTNLVGKYDQMYSKVAKIYGKT